MPTPNPWNTDEHKLGDREQRAAHGEDPGIESDPLPHHAHREHEESDEIEEAELTGDDLVELDEDDLKYADGPDA